MSNIHNTYWSLYGNKEQIQEVQRLIEEKDGDINEFVISFFSEMATGQFEDWDEDQLFIEDFDKKESCKEIGSTGIWCFSTMITGKYGKGIRFIEMLLYNYEGMGATYSGDTEYFKYYNNCQNGERWVCGSDMFYSSSELMEHLNSIGRKGKSIRMMSGDDWNDVSGIHYIKYEENDLNDNATESIQMLLGYVPVVIDGISYRLNYFKGTCKVEDVSAELHRVIIPNTIMYGGINFEVESINCRHEDSDEEMEGSVEEIWLPASIKNIGGIAFQHEGQIAIHLASPDPLPSLCEWELEDESEEGVCDAGVGTWEDYIELSDLRNEWAERQHGGYDDEEEEYEEEDDSDMFEGEGYIELRIKEMIGYDIMHNSFDNIDYAEIEDLEDEEQKVIRDRAILYVPKGCKAKYLESERWSKFSAIEEE